MKERNETKREVIIHEDFENTIDRACSECESFSENKRERTL